jgi:UDP-N-acetylglucosamine--N-acetylmuramyl-(pentapeptide) pyrophosphoryl-undecaprenol N-acetylglucosamine transferase
VRILFAGGGTGGHLYPGLAIARALVRVRPDVRPHFVGAERGIEREILPQTEFPHTLLDLHPLYRPQVWKNARTLAGLVSSWRGMQQLTAAERPALIVGTGGYASGAALLWGSRHDVPIVQHIGDSMPGKAARLFARWSTQCYLGFAEAEPFLPPRAGRYRVTGNPIEPPPEPRPDRAAARAQWGFPPDATVLLLFGGSQGSRVMNEAMAAWIGRGLPPSLHVIWATGRATYESFARYESTRVHVVPYLSPISDAFAATDVALVRGGMMGTAELCAWGIPMVIVPLPSAADDHQTKNAVALERAGAAVHLPQSALSPDALMREIGGRLADPAALAQLAAGARARAHPHAAATIAAHIDALLPRPR